VLCYVALGVALARLPGHVTNDLDAGSLAVGSTVGAGTGQRGEVPLLARSALLPGFGLALINVG
jgi:hypothetical protein